MGLDMYLQGTISKYDFEKPENNKKIDGFLVSAIHLELGYWRKHPNLHGYIVQTFADGVDECQQIYLNAEMLQKILEATKNDELPETTGFFFGVSRAEDKPRTIEILEKAIAWLEKEEKNTYKGIYYRASW